MSEPSYDVAIVGYGPTGATAAALLGEAGLRTFVCDRSEAIYDKPRAFALDHEIMRVLQGLGIADAVLAHAEPFTPSEFYGVEGQLIKRFTTAPPPYPFAFEPSLVFSQPDLERILREAVAARSSVEVALGWELRGIEMPARPEGEIELSLHAADGRTRAVRARSVIGCDGASSTVRGLTGIGLEDLGFDQPWLVVDVLANAAGLARLPKVSMQICEPARPCTYLVGPRNHRRWEIALDEGEDLAAAATPERTWALLSRWISPSEGELWRQASYRFHALVADRWRMGRVFVAGDAAHQQPPFLGQGMCQGIRDVANLSWKLAGVLTGASGDALLDTYAEERKQHVIELTTRIKAIGRLVGERDPARARARDAELLAACGGVVPSQPRQSVQPALAGGLLPFSQAAIGTLLPQPWIEAPEGPRRLDDVTGRGWRIVCDGVVPSDGAWPDTRSVRRDRLGRWPLTWVPIGAPGFIEREGVMRQWFDRQSVRFAIVRPDHVVCGAAVSLEDLREQLEDLSRRLT